MAKFRPDLLRALALALITGLLWCAIYHRWSAQEWQTPLAYTAEPDKSDVISLLAAVKLASHGNFTPFFFIDVPQLGAPFAGNWNDYPTTEKPLFCFAGLLATGLGLFAAANVTLLIVQMLAAVSFYAACRLLGASWIWAAAGGLIFACSRFVFAQGLHHLTVSTYWHVPFCLLVAEWLFQKESIRFGERRFLFALAVAVVTGVQHVYYTNMFIQLVMIAGLLQGWRQGWRALLPPVAIAAAAGFAFLLMNASTFLYHLVHGANSVAVSRDYHWLEVYGLKIVDFVVPPPDHCVPFLAAWGAAHLKEIYLAPGEWPPSAYLGVAGLAALGWLTLLSLWRAVENRRLPLETWFVLWIILYATVGGLNSILGVLGIEIFRTTTRYSIFILCVVLMFAVRRLSALERIPRPLAIIAAIVVVLVAITDQTPPWLSADDVAVTAKAVDSDRAFVRDMEQHLPDGAMVFELPVMQFPESPAPGLSPYDELRPFLFSDRLRFSFGSDKGRPQASWTDGLAHSTLAEIVQKLEAYGFGAIYINLAGFGAQGPEVIKQLQALGLTSMIQNDRGDLACVFLKPSPNPVLPAY